MAGSAARKASEKYDAYHGTTTYRTTVNDNVFGSLGALAGGTFGPAGAAAGGAIGSLLDNNVGTDGSATAAGGYTEAQAKTAAERMRLRGDYEGYRDVGTQGLAGLRNLLSNPEAMYNDPAYQFTRDEGLRGISSKASGMGTMQSGANLKDLMSFGQNHAMGFRKDLLSQYTNAANIGQNAIHSEASIGAGLTTSGAEFGARAGEYTGAGELGDRNRRDGDYRDLVSVLGNLSNTGAGGGTNANTNTDYSGGGTLAGGSISNTPNNYSEWDNI